MIPQEIIAKKRDGETLSDEEIHAFIGGVTSGAVTDAQIAAFSMATIWRGMAMQERVALTRAMTESGTVLRWDAEKLGGPAIDKHSTGGVGDKVSLLLGPIIAACGGFVPMISGRGLGHTGGTLDKFDAIPGYRTSVDLDTFRKVVTETGCAIVGATADIAPADKKIYAVRDVTGTVESIDLITASILSKKLAAGLHGLVMDVKFGSGAFMPTLDSARDLAESLVAVANGAGLPTLALLSDMNQVLGRNAGNALEVREIISILRGDEEGGRLTQLSCDLSAAILHKSGQYETLEQAESAVWESLSSGRAAERFAQMVTALGGPDDLMDAPDQYLAQAQVIREIHAEESGFVTAMNVKALGMAVVEMGGGRKKPDDRLDYAVGLENVIPLGGQTANQPLCILHAADTASADAAEARIRRAVTIGEAAPEIGALVAGHVA